MSDHLPLDAFEEQQELKEIPFIWSLIFGVGAVIIPLVLYLLFYLSEIIDVLNFTFPDIAIWVTVLLSFLSPYIASITALIHAKYKLGVTHRGNLFVHGLYVILIPCGIGAAAFVVTLIPESGSGMFWFIGLFYIPYIILGVVITALQSFFMSRQQPLISNKTLF